MTKVKMFVKSFPIPPLPIWQRSQKHSADYIDEVANPYIDQFIHGKLDGPIPVLGFGGK